MRPTDKETVSKLWKLVFWAEEIARTHSLNENELGVLEEQKP
jgi:hypothetical protein